MPPWPKEQIDKRELPAGVPQPPELGTRTPLDNAYWERDAVVAAFVRQAMGEGCRAWMGIHPGAGTDAWPAEWRYIVYCELPTGQVSWHIHELERPLFGFLRLGKRAEWDGHTTQQKYERLAAYVARWAEFHAPPPRPWWRVW